MYHLEIVADTAVEFADKVRALAAEFGIATSTVAVAAATAAPAEAEQPVLEPVKPSTRRRARTAAPEEQAPEAEQVDEAPADDAEAPAEEETVVPINNRRRRSAPAAETAPAATDAAAPAADDAVLRNLVLRLMSAKGGPAVRAVLDGFGIARTSEVAEDQVAELAKALEEAIAA